MKRFTSILMVFWVIGLSKAQNNLFPISCANDSENIISSTIEDILKSEELTSASCGSTSPYYSNKSLYLPQASDGIIYLKLNFIFLTKPDGTGNFEQNNSEHVGFIDEVINRVNQTLINLDGVPESGCVGYGQTNLNTTKIQFVINKIWKTDPAWDYLYTGYVPCTSQGSPVTCVNFSKVDPGSSDYYFTYFDNDSTIPSGINVVFANNGNIYNEFVNNNNYVMGYQEGWAIAQYPSNSNLSQKLRQFFPNAYLAYLWMKNYVADNPDSTSPAPNTPWPTVRSWYVANLRKSILHETGHNFGLGHENNCVVNIMNSIGTAPGNFLSNSQISTMHFTSSTTSIRQYFTEDSFKNTNLNVGSNELWDLNFRLYSNVKIDNNSSLKATCKIIMAPDSRFIVKDGSNFIIEGAEITSANKSSWNGIKVEGNGYLLINPNTLINNNHFYAYADNTPLPVGKNNYSSDKINKDIIENTIVDKDYRIYPNPTGDFINIETKNKIAKVEIYNLLNKSFSPIYKDNQVDVRNLPQGNYILKIYSNSGEKAIHFIKK